ncbi:DUF7619 domain-containing protein [Hymenobacter ruricola]|uniref:T9SS type A sorting domain-containing protein n=1 Tax=Hymenobacter ruricola TaxID=2791023 RepID=A0ABS0IAA3_9BACT|nr:T9SS type A sorting domain-containing protein [Hymenobacter ruricola]MBF9223891.1 T9SS type A sorting domain-containing protein [Hymenobacter ruricola]
MNLLKRVLLLLALVLSAQAGASAQVFEWATLAHNKGTNGSIGVSGTTDPAGNTYFGFGFVDSARVGGRLVRHPNNARNGYQIAKLDSTGRVVWVKPIRGINLPVSNLNGLKADPVNGGFFVSGDMYANALWDGVPVPGAALAGTGQVGFYGKCDANGTLLWARPLPTNYNWARSLAVDGLGNCYIAAGTSSYYAGSGTSTLGGQPIDSTETFLVGNNAAGTGEWTRRMHATPLPTPAQRYDPRCPSGVNGLQVGPKADGGCLLFGAFNEALYFGAPGNPPVLPSRLARNTFDDFIASVSPTGALTWIRPGRLGGTATTPVPGANAAAGDAAGNYYVTGSSSAGFSLAKYNAAGTLVWATNQVPKPGTAPNYNVGMLLAVDANGEATVQVDTDREPVIGDFILTEYHSLVHFDAAGVPRWVAASRSAGDPFPQTTTSDQDAVSVQLDAKGNVYYVTAPGSYSPNAISPSGSGLTPPTFLYGQLTRVGSGINVARIGTRHNTIRGRLYLDANGNGVRDAGEGAFPQNMVLQAIQPTTARLGTFDTSGEFNIYVGPGAYTLPAPVPPLHYALTEPTSGPYTGNFVGYGRVDTARHFGYRPIPNQLDLRATLTFYGAARPGFQARQLLTLENVGTATIPAGTATVTLDANTTYVGSYPNTTISGRVVRWNYPAIPPFGRRTLEVTVTIASSTPLSTTLTVAAAAPVTGDLVPADNNSSTTQGVTGSFDPNDLSVSYEQLTPTQVADRQPLDYTVRFQNMGTDTAFTVVVADTLDFRKLDLTTLQLVAESHPCTWSVSGEGNLVLRFLNIHLPYKAQNELGSQGFARFRVVPKTTLALGEVVHNKADIFFDYNAPVRTNTATTAVLMPTALRADARATAFTAFPNPARETVTLAADLPTAGKVRLSVLDALGRSVSELSLVAPAGALRHTLAVGTLKPGLYVLRLQLPDGSTTSQRLAVE